MAKRAVSTKFESRIEFASQGSEKRAGKQFCGGPTVLCRLPVIAIVVENPGRLHQQWLILQRRQWIGSVCRLGTISWLKFSSRIWSPQSHLDIRGGVSDHRHGVFQYLRRTSTPTSPRAAQSNSSAKRLVAGIGTIGSASTPGSSGSETPDNIDYVGIRARR